MQHRDYIVTANACDFLTSNSRASMEAAAARCGAGFHEIKTAPPGSEGMKPAFWRMFAFDIVPAARIFYLDADTVIRIDCPSPFETFPDESKPYGVRVRHGCPSCPALDALRAGHRQHIAAMKTIHGIELDAEKYINSGMFLISRQHHASQLARLREVARQSPPIADTNDQPYINALDGIELIDEAWNFTSPPAWGSMMTRWIYHFAAMPNRQALANQLDWKTVPSQAEVISRFFSRIPRSA